MHSDRGRQRQRADRGEKGKLTSRIRPLTRKHGQHQSKRQPQHRNDRNRPTHLPRIELTGLEAFHAPDQPAHNGNPPCHVVAGDEEREQRLGGDRVDQTQQAEDDRHDYQADDRVHGLVADALADVPEEVGEGEGAVARKGPDLTRGGGDQAQADEELDDDDETGEAEGAFLA